MNRSQSTELFLEKKFDNFMFLISGPRYTFGDKEFVIIVNSFEYKPFGEELST